jgi:hypothetical protein
MMHEKGRDCVDRDRSPLSACIPIHCACEKRQEQRVHRPLHAAGIRRWRAQGARSKPARCLPDSAGGAGGARLGPEARMGPLGARKHGVQRRCRRMPAVRTYICGPRANRWEAERGQANARREVNGAPRLTRL